MSIEFVLIAHGEKNPTFQCSNRQLSFSGSSKLSNFTDLLLWWTGKEGPKRNTTLAIIIISINVNITIIITIIIIMIIIIIE